MKITGFANSVDLSEVAHHEPPHLDLHCLHSSLWILNMINFGLNTFFFKFADDNFVVCFLVVQELKNKTKSKPVPHLPDENKQAIKDIPATWRQSIFFPELTTAVKC